MPAMTARENPFVAAAPPPEDAAVPHPADVLAADRTVADLGWLATVPADLVPPGLAEALGSRRAVLRRHAAVGLELDAARAALAPHLTADDPLAGVDAAGRVAALERLAAALPEVPVVGADLLEQVRLLVVQKLAAVDGLMLGRPPLFASELVHFETVDRQIPGILAPMPRDGELDAIAVYEAASATLAGFWRSIGWVRETDLGSVSLRDVLCALAAVFTEQVPPVVAAVADARERVAAADEGRERRRCPVHGLAGLVPEPRYGSTEAWTLEGAAR